MEHELQQIYPQIDVLVIRYILNNVSAGNKDLASETLGVLRPQDINELKEVKTKVPVLNITAIASRWRYDSNTKR
jgi:hypothetical protein